MKKLVLKIVFMELIVVLFLCCKSSAPVSETVDDIIQVEVPSKAHFRGIQAVTDDLVWLSGTEGTVLKTTNSGKKWKDITVPDCEKLDFRDIHAIDEDRAWVMSSGNGVRIYNTINGGKTWNLQFEDTVKKVFFDGIDFSDELNGVAYGDPINGSMDMLITTDGGKNWNRIPPENIPTAWEDEAGYAASGTGVVYSGNTIWVVTGGGEISRILKSTDSGKSWKAHLTTVIGGTGSGVFSMAFKDQMKGVVVGGNYLDTLSSKFNCAFTSDGGESWELVKNGGPRGYRSCVAITNRGTAVACGRTGVDKSSDYKVWTPVSDQGYFTCNAGDEKVWFAGRSGKVGWMEIK